MDDSLIMLIVFSLFLGCGCWLAFLWAVRNGEFNDIERPKHRMLDDEEPLPIPTPALPLKGTEPLSAAVPERLAGGSGSDTGFPPARE